MESDSELDPSELGSKEYWQKLYATELQNFSEFDDIGEIWFGVGCERRIVQWICSQPNMIPKSSKIMDVGCGNGSLLISLAKKGFINLYGVDYSEDAVRLAENVAKKENFPTIVYKEVDILKQNPDLESQFDVVLDKGTYDAISLMDSKSARTDYKSNLIKFFNHSHVSQKLFIIASCNWTKSELVTFFEPELKLVNEVESPSIQFGGKSGKTVTIIIFSFKIADD